MKFCNGCGVRIDDPAERCPLCFSGLVRLDSEPELETYPALLLRAERQSILKRVLVMLSLTAAIVCVIVNALTYRGIFWSVLVVANILYMWAAVGTAVSGRFKLGHNLVLQVISLAALLVLIDYFSGYFGWSLNYVVPFVFITAMLCITVIIIVRRMDARSFILYFFLTALLGFIPLVLLGLGLVSVPWPSITSAVYSGLSLISLFVFANRTTKQELRRRFHL